MEFKNSHYKNGNMPRGRYEDLVERHVEEMCRNPRGDSYDAVEEYMGFLESHVDYSDRRPRGEVVRGGSEFSYPPKSFQTARVSLGICVVRPARVKEDSF